MKAKKQVETTAPVGNRLKPHPKEVIPVGHACLQCENVNAVLWLKPGVGMKCDKRTRKDHASQHRNSAAM